MEKELEELKEKVSKLERLISRDEASPAPGSDSATPTPRVRDRPEYDQVDGWKLISLGALGQALERAQHCGHGQLVLVEVDRKLQRWGLAAVLGYVCKACGAQTLLPSSSYSRAGGDYRVNSQFRQTLGQAAYTALVSLLQEDISIRRVELQCRAGPPSLLTQFSEDPILPEVPAEEVQQHPPGEEVLLEGAAVKEEPSEFLQEQEEHFMEPAVCLTEGEAWLHGSSSPLLHPGTVTVNTPVLGQATVSPNTAVMGGSVTCQETDQAIGVHPTLFIRTTCSKIHLPPGIYKYARNNGLQSIMSVKTDTGTSEDIESHYRIMPTGKGVSSPGPHNIAESKRSSLPGLPASSLPGLPASSLPGRLTPFQLFSTELREKVGHKEALKEGFESLVTRQWAELSYEQKKVYTDQVHNGATPAKKKKHKTNRATNIRDIPLPALKRFAATIAPALKEQSPKLSELENRGQLNKMILKRWVSLPEQEKAKFQEASSPAPAGSLDLLLSPGPASTISEGPVKRRQGSNGSDIVDVTFAKILSPAPAPPPSNKQLAKKSAPAFVPEKTAVKRTSSLKESVKDEVIASKRIRIPKKIIDS